MLHNLMCSLLSYDIWFHCWWILCGMCDDHLLYFSLLVYWLRLNSDSSPEKITQWYLCKQKATYVWWCSRWCHLGFNKGWCRMDDSNSKVAAMFKYVPKILQRWLMPLKKDARLAEHPFHSDVSFSRTYPSKLRFYQWLSAARTPCLSL